MPTWQRCTLVGLRGIDIRVTQHTFRISIILFRIIIMDNVQLISGI